MHTDPLAQDYLRRLDAAASAMPPHRRRELVSEIRDHLDEALRQAPPGDEAAMRNALERLGPPEQIAAAADPAPAPLLLAAPVPETNGSAITSVLLGALWFAGIGSVLALVFGYRARQQIRNSVGGQKGSGLATAGIILGWIGIAILAAAAAVQVVAAIALTGFSASTGPASTLDATDWLPQYSN